MPGEAIALDRDDFDAAAGVLTIHKGKLGKSRELPLHASTVTALHNVSGNPAALLLTESGADRSVEGLRRHFGVISAAQDSEALGVEFGRVCLPNLSRLAAFTISRNCKSPLVSDTASVRRANLTVVCGARKPTQHHAHHAPRQRRYAEEGTLSRFRCDYPVELIHDCAHRFLASYAFRGRELVYCDPPYLHHTGGSPRRYRYEYEEQDHVELLTLLKRLPCHVMLSGYPSSLYDELLGDWQSIELQVMNQAGVVTEKVWFNFTVDRVHWPRYAGKNHTDRQRIKRLAESWGRRYAALPGGGRLAVLAAIMAVEAGEVMPTSPRVRRSPPPESKHSRNYVRRSIRGDRAPGRARSAFQ